MQQQSLAIQQFSPNQGRCCSEHCFMQITLLETRRLILYLCSSDTKVSHTLKCHESLLSVDAFQVSFLQLAYVRGLEYQARHLPKEGGMSWQLLATRVCQQLLCLPFLTFSFFLLFRLCCYSHSSSYGCSIPPPSREIQTEFFKESSIWFHRAFLPAVEMF